MYSIVAVFNFQYFQYSIHAANQQLLATELCKTKQNRAASIIHEIFEQRNIQYNLRSQTHFQLRSDKTVNCGLRSRSFMISDLCSETKGFSVRARLLAICRGELSAVIALANVSVFVKRVVEES